MGFLRERLDSIVYEVQYDAIYGKVKTLAASLGIEISKEDERHGEMILKYLVKLFDMLVWKCWGDTVLLSFIAIDKNKTRIDVFGLPNLFRYKIRKNEKVRDIGYLLEQLRSLR